MQISVDIAGRLLYFSLEQAINKIWTLDIPGQITGTSHCIFFVV
jgi:hypothetical protein